MTQKMFQEKLFGRHLFQHTVAVMWGSKS